MVGMFETRLSDHIAQMDSESARLKQMLKDIIIKGDTRTGEANRVYESVEKMYQILSVMRRLNFKDELVNQEVKRRISKIFEKAMVLAEEERYELQRQY